MWFLRETITLTKSQTMTKYDKVWQSMQGKVEESNVGNHQ